MSCRNRESNMSFTCRLIRRPGHPEISSSDQPRSHPRPEAVRDRRQTTVVVVRVTSKRESGRDRSSHRWRREAVKRVQVIFGWRDVLLVVGLLLGWRRAHERLRPEALRPRHEFVGLQRFSDHVPSNLYILSEAK
jgi:hypothetical protein